jgi:hypothetical protein
MSADPKTPAPSGGKLSIGYRPSAVGNSGRQNRAHTGRKKTAQGNSLGKTPPKNTSSPEGAKEGSNPPGGWTSSRPDELNEVPAA